MDWSSRESSGEAMAGALRLLGIGHSHLTGLQHADGCREPAPGRTIFHFVQMLEPRFDPNLVSDAAGRPALHPSLLASLDAATYGGEDGGDSGGNDQAAPTLVFAAISGNEHHSLGMVNHPRRFDFVLREKPHLPLWPGGEIVPAGLVEAALAGMTMMATLQLVALRRATALPILLVCSPPPVPDNDFVAKQETMFTEAIGRLGVAPASLRWKLWRLQSRIFEQASAANAITFLPPPDEAVDADGFLREEAWHGDSVHANIWYGERVLRQIEAAARALPRGAA